MPENPIAPFLERHGVLILDGALATELERRGADLDDPLWSARVLIENSALIGEVHRDYFEAGADVAITASYQASFAGFARRGLDAARAADLLRGSVQLAREARDAFWSRADARTRRLRPLVAASVGPYGACLHDGSEYRGDYRVGRAKLVDFHAERLALLAAAGADLLACETIPSRLEAEVLVDLLEQQRVPAWLSFSCRDAAHISDGTPFVECVRLAAASRAIVAVGVNCTPPWLIEALVERAAAATDKAIVVYPNSGERYEAHGNRWLPAVADGRLVGAVRRWHAAGARLIGGCCRTGPADIAAIAGLLRP